MPAAATPDALAPRREEVLRSAGLIGVVPEERFDRIVRLAAKLLDVPMVMLNLVGDQQYTHTSYGIRGGVTPLADSVCRHAVEAGKRLEVLDLRADDRFATNPSVTKGQGLRFYAAETLAIDGVPIGTLCVLDTEPRALSSDQVEVLNELAAWAEAELNNKALNDLARAAEEREALTRALLLSAGDGIVGSDADGVIHFVNRAAAQMLGWEEHELVGRILHDVAHHTRPDGSPYPVTECPSHTAIAQGRSLAAHEDLFWRRDHTPVPIEMTVAALDHGPRSGAVTVFRDISERHEVQRLKAEFVGVVSHELRTPLTSILGSLKLLDAGVVTPVDASQRPLLDMALSNAQRLAALVDDILDMERLDGGRLPLTPAPVDATDMARRVVDQLQPAAHLEQVALILDGPDPGPVIHVDHSRLVQALTNLVGNALKFTDSGGTVTVRVATATTDAGPQVRLQVHDTGRGIAADDLARVFDRFQQVGSADAASRRGTGLGLAITQGIVERSGGSVEVTSTPGVGSVFTIVLPAAPNSPSTHSPPVRSPRAPP